MFKINLRDLIQFGDHPKSPQYFLFNLVVLTVIKLFEIILEEKQFSFFRHKAKVQKVVLSDNFVA